MGTENKKVASEKLMKKILNNEAKIDALINDYSKRMANDDISKEDIMNEILIKAASILNKKFNEIKDLLI